MNPENFAEWLRRQGHRIYHTESSYWAELGPRVVQAFPYHWLIQPTPEELASLLKTNRLIGLRYSTPITEAIGHVSYHASYELETYEIEQLSKWSRKNIRRGLRNCEVTPIGFDLLMEKGYAIQRDTLSRQQRESGTDRARWQKLVQAAADIPGFEVWGALVEGQLAASVITFLMDDCIYMLYQQTHQDYLKFHVSNALAYTVTQTVLERPEVKTILYGLHSLDAPASVDEFKFRMGYTAKPVRQRTMFHPWLSPLLTNPLSSRLAGFLSQYSISDTVNKAEGMIRFHNTGKLPLTQQPIPDLLPDATTLKQWDYNQDKASN